MSLRLTFVAALWLGLLGASAAQSQALRRNVFVSGTDGYHTYRIPALIAMPTGTLLAFCEGRRNNHEDTGDIDLLLKRSHNGGQTWSAAQVVHERGGEAASPSATPVRSWIRPTTDCTCCSWKTTTVCSRSTATTRAKPGLPRRSAPIS